MKARNKFLVGGAIVLGTSGFLMWSAIKSTGQYLVTPAEFHAMIAKDPRVAMTNVRIGATAVPGSIVRQPGGRDYAFRAAYEGDTLNVAYHGIAPDTFTDGVNITVEGHLDPNGTFVATTLLAKCASRYENGPPGAPGVRTTATAGATQE